MELVLVVAISKKSDKKTTKIRYPVANCSWSKNTEPLNPPRKMNNALIIINAEARTILGKFSVPVERLTTEAVKNASNIAGP
jgi:hypothetical protein